MRRVNNHAMVSPRLKSSLAFAAVLLCTVILPARAAELEVQQQLVDDAQLTIEYFAADPQMEWFHAKAQYARGIFIVPSIVRGAFMIGASVGNGVLLARENITVPWSEPAFYDIGGASFGFQMGGDASELVLVIMTERGLKSFYNSSFKLGGDASLAAGSEGTGLKGGTSPTLSADIISFGRAKGGYLGISLGGAVVRASHGRNQAYYGLEVKPIDILEKGVVKNTGSAALRAAVAKATQPQNTTKE